MMRFHLQKLMVGLLIVMLAGLMLVAQNTQAAGQATLIEIPKKLMDTLKSKFPKAKINKVSKEKENGVVIYDFEFTINGHKYEADIKEDGSIHNWEKEIAAKDLPAAVRKAVNKKFPRHTKKEIMQITAVKEGKDVLEGFEIVLVTADKKGVEVMVTPNGKIVEEEKLN